jgi:large subunit ribosomal protein L25
MEEIFLSVETRQEIGKSKIRDLRGQGFVAGVVYGEGKFSVPIKMSHHELVQLVHQHHVETAIIKVRIKDDKKKDRPCLIKEIQYDPVKGDIVHVDFNEINLTKAIKVNVPINAVGESVGVKMEGGSLEKILWEVEIECLPTDIPKGIDVDIAPLKLGESVFVKDLKVPANIKILNDLDSIVLTVAAPMKEEVVAAEGVEGEAAKEPEVIKEKKEVPAEGEAEGKEAKKETKEEKK